MPQIDRLLMYQSWLDIYLVALPVFTYLALSCGDSTRLRDEFGEVAPSDGFRHELSFQNSNFGANKGSTEKGEEPDKWHWGREAEVRMEEVLLGGKVYVGRVEME